MQVDFPLVLDMYDFCSDELKKQLAGPREAVKAEEDRIANIDRAVKKAKMVTHSYHQVAVMILQNLPTMARRHHMPVLVEAWLCSPAESDCWLARFFVSALHNNTRARCPCTEHC